MAETEKSRGDTPESFFCPPVGSLAMSLGLWRGLYIIGPRAVSGPIIDVKEKTGGAWLSVKVLSLATGLCSFRLDYDTA